jgi:predicted alpha/beta superfamily hydrolase
MKRFWLILFIVVTVKASAQFPRVDIPGSEVRKITSSIVAGQEYELHILLPGGYKNSNKNYPVVYLMDSQWDFPLVKSIYGQYYYDGFIPELIIVGVTWGGTNPNADSLRARDYTPTNDRRLKQSGGAENFLSFMRNELFPFIQNNYRADSSNRSIMGCSLGGLITMYALFTHPEMFKGYAAASPATGWDKEVIYQYEQKFYERSLFIKTANGSLRLYMTIGDVERDVPGFEKLSKFLSARNYKALLFKSKVLENTGHSGTKSETFSRGLQYIFERPKLALDKTILDKYSGSYTGAGKIEIKNEDGKLVLYLFAGNKYELFAASETDFYSLTEFLNIHFRVKEGIVEGFDINRYGSTQFIKRTN